MLTAGCVNKRGAPGRQFSQKRQTVVLGAVWKL